MTRQRSAALAPPPRATPRRWRWRHAIVATVCGVLALAEGLAELGASSPPPCGPRVEHGPAPAVRVRAIAHHRPTPPPREASRVEPAARPIASPSRPRAAARPRRDKLVLDHGPDCVLTGLF